jgi:hypothetical protein
MKSGNGVGAANLSRNPALVRDWKKRLLADDPKVGGTAEAALS